MSDEEQSAYGYRQDDWVEIPLEEGAALQPQPEWPWVCIPLANCQKQLIPFLEQCVTRSLAAAIQEDGGG